MAELIGNLLVGQSGGPTAVINASVAGVIQQARKYPFIQNIYGGLNGILGILNEQLIDLNQETPDTLKTDPPVDTAPYRDGFGNICLTQQISETSAGGGPVQLTVNKSAADGGRSLLDGRLRIAESDGSAIE